jgi:transposase
LENAASVFSEGNEDKKSIQDAERESEELFKHIGQLKVENDWLKNKVL